MSSRLFLYNTLSRTKEPFEPINPPFAGMYVCGPTVYGEPHLGHARPAITFDVLFRYLLHIGFKVRYVRNITDVGHLEQDADDGEDKMLKKARIENLEPMEVAQQYTLSYHEAMKTLNNLPPSIEPRATGHIIEQISLIEEILKNGFAYVVNGSVYFDVDKYSKQHHYGKLSGRVLEDLMAGGQGRDLEGQGEKKNPVDFALWKKAGREHIMQWPSPWGDGFPGWHIECSAMGAKYLGQPFDIHGGGMDLLFPHHECEIAQSVAGHKTEPVKYWVHNNMITINGQKMGKSLGNFINLKEFFSGSHTLLEQAYSPMTIRFFMLQAHYRSTLDFSNDALQAADKGYRRMMAAYTLIDKLPLSENATVSPNELLQKSYDAINDDLNTPIVLANLFEAVRQINSAHAGTEKATSNDIADFKNLFEIFFFEILGMAQEAGAGTNNEISDGLMKIILDLRKEAKTKKDFSASDKIREELQKLNVQIKDNKDGTTWEISN